MTDMNDKQGLEYYYFLCNDSKIQKPYFKAAQRVRREQNLKICYNYDIIIIESEGE